MSLAVPNLPIPTFAVEPAERQEPLPADPEQFVSLAGQPTTELYAQQHCCTMIMGTLNNCFAQHSQYAVLHNIDDRAEYPDDSLSLEGDDPSVVQPSGVPVDIHSCEDPWCAQPVLDLCFRPAPMDDWYRNESNYSADPN